MTLYVLSLREGKYYVGVTSNLPARLRDHFNGEGAVWTTKYLPVAVVYLGPVTGPMSEDALTESYMLEYGIENVRGGSYSSIELTPAEREVLRKKFCTATGTCFRCDKLGHFARDCPNTAGK